MGQPPIPQIRQIRATPPQGVAAVPPAGVSKKRLPRKKGSDGKWIISLFAFFPTIFALKELARMAIYLIKKFYVIFCQFLL